MFLIPSLILGTYLAAATMRMTRTMMLEVLRQDYIRTAWSKGLKERVVVVRHAVKIDVADGPTLAARRKDHTFEGMITLIAALTWSPTAALRFWYSEGGWTE